MSERNINWLPFLCAPDWGPNWQSRFVPWMGIEPATFWFTCWYSNQPSHTGQGSLLSFCVAWLLHIYCYIVFVFFNPHPRTCFLILERGEGERGWETSMWGTNIDWLPSHAFWPGTKLKPRHVPWLGIEPVTFQFTGQCSNQLSHTSQGAVLNDVHLIHDNLSSLLMTDIWVVLSSLITGNSCNPGEHMLPISLWATKIFFYVLLVPFL